MFVYYIFLFSIVGELFCVLGQTNIRGPQTKKWKCANSDCTKPISLAEVVVPLLHPDHELKLPLKMRDEVEVLRKPSDKENEKNFWWISIDGKEGFAYKSHLREKKILSLEKTLIEKISPTPTIQVVDGTTISYDGDFDENINPPNIYNYTPMNTPQDFNDNNDTDVKQEEDEDISVEVEVDEEKEEIPDPINNYTNPMSDGILDSKSSVNSERLSQNDILENTSSTVLAQVGDNNSLEENLVNVPIGSEISPETTNAKLIANKESSELVKEVDEVKKDKENEDSKVITFEKLPDTTAPPVEINMQTSINRENIDGINQGVKEQIQSQPNLSSPKTSPLLKKEKEGSEVTSDKIANPLNLYEETSSFSENKPTNDKIETSSVPTVATHNFYQPPLIKPEEKTIVNHASAPETETVDTTAVQPERNMVPDASNENISPPVDKIEKEKVGSVTEYPPQHNYNENLNKILDQKNFAESTTESMKYENRVTGKMEGISSEVKDRINDEQNKINNFFDSRQVDKTLDHGNLNSESNSGKQVQSDILPDAGKEKSNSIPNVGTKESGSVPDAGIEVSDSIADAGMIKSDNLPPDSEMEISNNSSDLGLDDASNNLPNESIKNEDISDESNNADILINNERVEKIENLDNTYVEKVVSNFEDENNGDSSMNWFSSVYSFMGSLKELYTSSFGKEEVSEPENIQSVKMTESYNNLSPVECENQNSESPNGYCQTSTESIIYPVEDDVLPQINLEEAYVKMDNGDPGIWMSFKSMMGIGFSAIVAVVFSLGYYYIDNLKRDGELVQKNNALASELFVVEREKNILEEDIAKLKEDFEMAIEEKNTFGGQSALLKDELNKIKEEKYIIEERESKQKKKLAMVEQNYNELRKIFSDTKQKGERLTLISDINKLKESIAADNIEIASLKEELQERKTEIKTLTTNLQKSQEAKTTLEDKIDKLVTEGKDIAKDYQETLSKMEQTIEENKVVQSQLEEDVRKLKKECESLIIQKELSESALQKAHGITSKESLAEWLEVRDIRSSFISAEKEITKLTKEGDELSVGLKTAEEKVKSLTVELANLNEKYENAEKEKIEALTKLQVLSNYFKEKETQLQEELGMKEAQWLQKQSDDSTIYQQMRDLREENVNLKTLIETLKKEILDQEASYKKIVNTTEQKAHENWVSLRRAEVRLKEVQAEAAQLRNRLTTLETCDNPEDKLNKTASGGLEVNGDLPQLGSAMSPPFMLYPNEFIPPPPLIQVPQNSSGNPSSRPAPLGRISSPPLVSGDFIPPPPIIPFELYPHIHPNPPSPPMPQPVLHKPQPRDHHHMAMPPQVPPARKQKDSQSSNQSSESPLDNKTPARRSKR